VGRVVRQVRIFEIACAASHRSRSLAGWLREHQREIS
jgi:hypothetical protein